MTCTKYVFYKLKLKIYCEFLLMNIIHSISNLNTPVVYNTVKIIVN